MSNKIRNLFNNLTIGTEEDTIESHNPNKAWAKMNCMKKVVKKVVKPLDLTTPIDENKIRVCCISDTHNRTSKMRHEIPKAHILIHAGDFTMHGNLSEVEEFCNFLSTLPKEQHKIVIAGNHETCLDNRCKSQENIHHIVSLLEKQCIYLQDSSVKICGLKIFGSPWQPRHCNNAFQIERGKRLREKWEQIPTDTDILVTHGPPAGYGDMPDVDWHVGCVDLLKEVKDRIQPKYHIFGHIHEDHGIWTDDKTTFINASICAAGYKPINEPVLIDIDIPKDFDKNDLPII